jgi:acetyl/propionyl-CoA carboxylase alpha subunit
MNSKWGGEGTLTLIELDCEGRNYSAEVESSDREDTVRIEGIVFRISVRRRDGNLLLVEVNGMQKKVEILEDSDQSITLKLDGEPLTYRRSKRGEGSARKVGQERRLLSPLPGRILEVLVKPGLRVHLGDPLLVIESMKMETTIRADRDAVITDVPVRDGETVQRGQLLLTFD